MTKISTLADQVTQLQAGERWISWALAPNSEVIRSIKSMIMLDARKRKR